MSKKIAIILTDRFARRNIETSGLLEELKRRKFDLELVDNCYNKNVICRLVNYIKRRIYDIIQFRFLEINNIKKHLLKKKYKSKSHFKNDKINSYLGFPFPRSRWIYLCLQKLYKKLPACFLDLKIDCIIVTNLQDPYAQSCIKWAEKKGDVKVFPILNSWDHLTHGAKVLDSYCIPFYMVWNKIQNNEMVTLHEINPEKLRIVGSLQFEYLSRFKKKYLNNSKMVVEKFQLESDERIIFLPAYNMRLGEFEPYVVKKILENSSKIQAKFRIIIRPYPKDDQFYQRFSSVINHPNVQIMHIDADPKKDRANLALLLNSSDVVICGAGTIALEAMYYDTPVIHLGIDTRERDEIDTLHKEYFYSDHYIHIMNRKASYYVTSTNKLIRAINDYFLNPKIHQKERSQVIIDQLGGFNTEPGKKIASLIDQEI